MSGEHYSDETLMAFADGELAAVEAEAVAQAVERDPSLAARVEALAEGRRLTKQAFAAYVPSESGALEARIRAMATKAAAKPEPVVRAPAANDNRWILRAAAAAVAGIACAVAGYMAGASRPATVLQLAAGDAAPDAVAQALSSTPSGGSSDLPGGARFEAVASFRVGDTLCREFRLVSGADATLAIACHTSGEWTSSFALLTASGGSGYVPASGVGALDAYLVEAEAGDPLDAAAEAAALAAL